MMSGRPVVTQPRHDFFFHSPSFVFRNGSQDVHLFRAGEREGESARIYFTRTNECITSLDRSSFGSFILEGVTSADPIRKLIIEIESWCRNNHVREIRIRNYPTVYDPAGAALIHEALSTTGFRVAKTELLQFINIGENSSERLNRNRKRKLNDCIKAGLEFVRLGSESLEDAYQIFVECRTEKNYPITTPLATFCAAFEQFPDQYFLFGVKDGEDLLAASVCVKVNDRILYDFFHGDKISARKLSPLTLLVTGLIDFCRKGGFRLLDLGVSTDSHGINKGLTQFKKSFGADTSQKLTYHKSLNA
jgi:hypothetical protein